LDKTVQYSLSNFYSGIIFQPQTHTDILTERLARPKGIIALRKDDNTFLCRLMTIFARRL